VSRWRLILSPLLALALALGLTWLVWSHERQLSEKELRAQFDFSLREAVSRVEQRMAACEQMLRGVQGLFAASGKVGRDEFRDYVEALRLDAHFTGVQGIGIAQWVPAARRDSHVDAMRRQALPDYAIRPLGPREAFAPITQIEPPLAGNRLPIGFDAWSEPIRRAAMEKARDSGMPAISGKLPLASDDEQDTGFIMYLPIFERGKAIDTVRARRAHLAGWVFAAFRMNKLMASLYGEQSPGLDLAIYDGVAASPAALLYRSAEPGDRSTGAAIAANEYLVVAGHSWMLSMSSGQDFAARHGRNAELLIAVTGIAVSLLLALLAWLMVTGRARAMRLATAMTQELRASEQRWSFALEGAGDGVWDWNLQTRATVNSRRLKEIIGVDDRDDQDTIEAWERRVHPDDVLEFRASMQTCLTAAQGDNANCVAEYRVRIDDSIDEAIDKSRWKWVLSRGMVVERDAQGRPLRIIGTLSDISNRKAMEEQVRRLAFHDPLTNLPNRRLLNDRLSQAMAAGQRSGLYGALMFLDLDNFKLLNDTHGHEVGDLLLIQVAERLKYCVRETDTVARFGGDEFVVMIRELEKGRVQSGAEARRIAEKIRDTLADAYVLRIRRLGAADQIVEHQCTASIGLTLFIGHQVSQDDILKWADTAMYRAKEAGSNLIQEAPEMPAGGTEIAWPSLWPSSSPGSSPTPVGPPLIDQRG
jgi:diguanylate cyclase (GGDEF)-like protein